MTVIAVMVRLLPIMWELRNRLGGDAAHRRADDRRCMISSTALALIVIPAIYGIVKGWRLSKQPPLHRASGPIDAP